MGKKGNLVSHIYNIFKKVRGCVNYPYLIINYCKIKWSEIIIPNSISAVQEWCYNSWLNEPSSNHIPFSFSLTNCILADYFPELTPKYKVGSSLFFMQNLLSSLPNSFSNTHFYYALFVNCDCIILVPAFTDFPFGHNIIFEHKFLIT